MIEIHAPQHVSGFRVCFTISRNLQWQRDIAERGATMEEVQAAIDARKPDFAAYVEPQKEKAERRASVFGRRFAASARWFDELLPPPRNGVTSDLDGSS